MTEGTVAAEAPAIVAPVEAAPAAEAVAADTPVVDVVEGGDSAPDSAAEPVAEPSEDAEAESPLAGDAPAPEAEPEFAPEAEPIVYEPWVIPQDMTIEAEQLSELNEVIGKHRLDQAAAQEIIDAGAKLLRDIQTKSAEQIQTQVLQEIQQSNADQFTETKKSWQADFDKRVGNQRNTYLDDAKLAIRTALPDDMARKEALDALAVSGLDHHPAIITLLANLGRPNRERRAPVPSSPTAQAQTPEVRRYGRRN